MALAGTSGSIETVARPVDESPTATNAHDLVTSARGGKRRPEPIYLLLLFMIIIIITVRGIE
jgi:accessory gene regulator protein AgrB